MKDDHPDSPTCLKTGQWKFSPFILTLLEPSEPDVSDVGHMSLRKALQLLEYFGSTEWKKVISRRVIYPNDRQSFVLSGSDQRMNSSKDSTVELECRTAAFDITEPSALLPGGMSSTETGTCHGLPHFEIQKF